MKPGGGGGAGSSQVEWKPRRRLMSRKIMFELQTRPVTVPSLAGGITGGRVVRVGTSRRFAGFGWCQNRTPDSRDSDRSKPQIIRFPDGGCNRAGWLQHVGV